MPERVYVVRPKGSVRHIRKGWWYMTTFCGVRWPWDVDAAAHDWGRSLAELMALPVCKACDRNAAKAGR